MGSKRMIRGDLQNVTRGQVRCYLRSGRIFPAV